MTKIEGPAADALQRMIAIAKGNTGQSRRVADFLLTWWSASEFGGFDFTTMWGSDTKVVEDMATVFAWIGMHPHYPDALGLEVDFADIIREWRPS